MNIKTFRWDILGLRIAVLLFISINCQAKDLYVSPNGNDRNSGTKEKPFQSIKKAQQEVRKIEDAVTVYLRAGVYYLKEPIVFTASDSRKENQAVIYKAFEGEHVTICGSAQLKLDWHRYKGDIMQAAIPPNILFDQLFVNGQLQHMARYPNYDANIRHYGGTAEDAISVERIKKWQDPSGAYIHALHDSEWGGLSYMVKGKDANGNLTMEGGFQNNRPSKMHKKFRFVENVFEELDTVNEWYFDRKKRTLYYYPQAGTDLSKANIESPQLETLFEFKGTEKQPIKNISIEGLELTQTLRTFMKNKEPLLRSDWTVYRLGAITMEGTEHCAIKNCYFNTVGGNAMVFTNYNRHDELSGCRIANVGSSAVVFVGDPKAVRSPLFRYEESNVLEQIDRTPGPKTNNYPADCLVYNNLIEDIGKVEKQVAGVEISMAERVTVSHNTIDNVPRAGINIGEGTWGGHIIEHNDVFNTVLETGDHGAFNSWGRDRYWFADRKKMDSITAIHPELILLDMTKPNIIRNNRFRCDHGWDIDLDDGSSNYEIYNNVCLNGGLKLREGFYRKVFNNIIINNSFHPHVWFANSGDVFKQNIVASGYFPIGMKSWGKEIDYNLFPDSISLSKVQGKGTDKHSVFGNPMFADVSSANYSVGESSPAFKIGFKNFPMDEFGVVSASLKLIARKVDIPLMVSAKKDKANIKEVYEFLGASVKNLNTLGERSATGMASETGVLVLEVDKKSVMYGKVNPNDVILKFNDQTIANVSNLLAVKMALQLANKATVTVFRNQALKRIEIVLK